MTEDMTLWWPLYWSAQHGMRSVPLPLLLLWHANNEARFAVSRLSTDPFPEGVMRLLPETP